jgi:hypothetical protein
LIREEAAGILRRYPPKCASIQVINGAVEYPFWAEAAGMTKMEASPMPVPMFASKAALPTGRSHDRQQAAGHPQLPGFIERGAQ